MEGIAAPGSYSNTADQDKEAPSIHTIHLSHQNQSERKEFPKYKAKETKWMDKGKAREQTHGVMSLPAEIRETYVFQSPMNLDPRLLDLYLTDFGALLAASSTLQTPRLLPLSSLSTTRGARHPKRHISTPIISHDVLPSLALTVTLEGHLPRTVCQS